MSYEAFAGRIDTQSLRCIAQHWLNARGARRMPSWGDIRLSDIQKLMPIMWVYRYDHVSERFTGRVAGANIEQIFGKSFSGVAMEDLYPPSDYPRLYARAKRVVTTPELYRGTGMVFRHLDHSGNGERIMLPLASDGVHGDGILGATVYEFFLGDRVENVPENDDWFAL